jgi:hypothetical protein
LGLALAIQDLNETIVDKPGKGSFYATDLDLLPRGVFGAVATSEAFLKVLQGLLVSEVCVIGRQDLG